MESERLPHLPVLLKPFLRGPTSLSEDLPRDLAFDVFECAGTRRLPLRLGTGDPTMESLGPTIFGSQLGAGFRNL